jgi:hypothetical protein
MMNPRANAKPRSKRITTVQVTRTEVFSHYMNTCLWCLTKFKSRRPAKYCHERCRSWAWQARQK